MIIKKLTLKNAYKRICLIFSWLSSFYFPNKITGLNELSKKNKILKRIHHGITLSLFEINTNLQ